MKITPTYMSTHKRGECWGGNLISEIISCNFEKVGNHIKKFPKSPVVLNIVYKLKKTLQTIARIGEWIFVSISWNKRRTIWKWLRLVVHWAGGYVFEGSFTEAAGRHSLIRERFGNDANHCLSVLVYIPHFKFRFYFLSSAFSTWICSWSFAHYL